MSTKHGLRSIFAKFLESSPSNINSLLLGGDENSSTEEQWIISPFFKDHLFDKSLDWDSIPCSEDPPCIACGEPDDLLTMDMDLNHILRLDTCRREFAPTIDMVFKHFCF